MKKIIITFTLFICVIATFAQNNIPNKLKLKSKVKTLQQFHYLASETSNGYVKGKLISNDYLKFDTNGENIDKKLIGYGINGNNDITTKNELNNDGRVIKSSTFDNLGKLKSIVKYQYDGDGKEIKQIKYDSNNSFLSSETSNYNSKGLLSELTTELQLSNGLSISKHTFTYDEKNRKVQELWLSKEGNIINTIITSYSQDKSIEISSFSGYGYTSKSKKIYDKYQNLIEDFTYEKDDNLKERTVRKFDQLNNITDLIEYDSNGKVTQHNSFRYKGISKN